MAIITWNGHSKPLAIRIGLGGGDSIDPAAFHMKTDCGETLLHKIVQGMAAAHAAKRTDDIVEWRLLLAEAISASANIFQLAQYEEIVGNPLQLFLFWFRVRNSESYPEWLMPRDYILCIWLSELKRAGIDLEEYGAFQQEWFKLDYVPQEFPVWADSGCSSQKNDDRPWGKLLGLEYGPEPEDWRIFITNPVDEYVGEFWESVQRGFEVMPGTWVD